MSWFSLIDSQKNLLKSQECVNNALSGYIVGEIVVDQFLHHAHLYRKIRQAVSTFFVEQSTKTLFIISADLSNKILMRVVEHRTFPVLFPEVFDRLHLLRHLNEIDDCTEESEQILDDNPPSSTSSIQHLVHLLFDNYVIGDPEILSDCLKASLMSQDAFNAFVKKSLVEALRPICEKAIHASLMTLVRKCTKHTFDYSVKKIISLGTLPFFYSLSQNFMSSQFDSNHQISKLVKSLPSPAQVLWTNTALHALQHLYTYRQALHTSSKFTHKDKENVKKFIFKISKEPMISALKANHLFQILQIDLEAAKIDALVKLLIDEAVDFFWDDLHHAKFLNLPLVS